jgi:two-component system nitrogen regulation sensor histidine kinase NtrY
MPRFAKFFTYERRIIGTALVAVVPLAAAAALLVASGDFAPIVSWTVTLLIVATLIVATFALHEVIAYPLRTLANVVSAVRDEDYSLRAREAAEGAVFGEVLLELNDLSAALRDRRLAAVEAVALVRGVMEEVDAGIFAFDPSSRLELVNRAGEHLLRESSPRLLGRTAAELGLADLLDGAEGGTVERNFGGLTARWNVRVSTFRREGEMHRLLVIADISRALRQEEIRAWQRLVRVLGHELNNSLAPIKSIAGSLEEALAAKPFDARLQSDLARGLGIISRRADSLTRFLSAYAQLARLPEPTPKPIELGSVVRRAVALDRRIEVEVDAGPTIELDADDVQLEQVIINVVKNAIDAALETGGGVTVTWRTNAGAAEVAVTDEGPGLASTANAFVPFFTTKPNGSGIGLVLSRQIAEAHGGTLTLQNRTDRTGCEAVLRIPLRAQ